MPKSIPSRATIPAILLAATGLLPLHEVRAAPLLGVNLAGGEASSKTMPGRFGYNYVYPKKSDIDLAYGLGVRLFRIPLREDRVQQGIRGPMRPEVRQAIYPIIDYALAKPGAVVLIDWHSFGKRSGVAYGTAPWDVGAIADLNAKFLGRYANNARVWVGLQNEPKGAGANWWPTAQAVVLDLRKRGLRNRMVVAGDGYSAAWSWPRGNGPAAAAFKDPARNTVFEAHSYFDANGSGTNKACKPGTEARIGPAIRHAEQHGYRLLFGELAVGAGPTCDEVRRKVIAALRSSPQVVGAAWWAMGDFYPFPKYMYGLTGPVKGTASPLLTTLAADWRK